MSADYMDRLSEFVAQTRLEDLASSTVNAAKTVILDTIGAVLAGSRLPENANFARLAQEMGGTGPATLLGHSGKVQPGFAALVNGTAGVALEMDEGSRLGGGHPSIHVTPGAMAVAEAQGASGKAFLEAVIIGYEVTARMGAATTAKAEIHSHGTWGTIGTAAAAARLLGLDAAETRQAMSMAVSMSPANTWTPCIEGATIRNLYPGRSGFQGILAAQLVRCGFTGIKDAPRDLYDGILGDGFDASAVLDGLGESGGYRIERNYFKFHACCLYNHPVIDAVQAISRKKDFTAAEVEHIRVEAPPLALIMADPEPENMLAAKFSIPYAVAASVVHGATDVTAFYPEKVADRQVRALARKVEVAADPEMSLRRFDYPSARVTVFTGDGQVLTEEVTAQYGDAANPAPREVLLDKFNYLAKGTLGSARTAEVVELADRLDMLADLRELTGLLA